MLWKQVVTISQVIKGHSLGIDGGIEVTASHNPMNYNGMKLVREGSRPISGDTGLRDVQRLAEANDFAPVDAAKRGSYKQISVLDAYVDHLMGYIDLANFTKPMTLVINSGNGAAGHIIDEIEKRFQQANAPVTFVKVHHEANGHFPNGIPNPLLPECRKDTSDAVKANKADMGIAFDGDFDRCFLFDENAEFIEGYYIVGLLAEAFLKKEPGAKIIHDPRLTWNTIDVVTKAGGIPVMSKTGHAFIKERMREEDAVYGGEMSAHHYFRDFAYCDSGMIPWLLSAELLAVKGTTLSDMIKERLTKYPCSGKVNFNIENKSAAIAAIKDLFSVKCLEINHTDGLSIDHENWRINVRTSNTEPLLRVNIEGKSNPGMVEEKLTEVKKS
ncbi:ManB protein [Plautia stali symbiont]|nr:ManB protein [Plautia stali symbiont]